MEKVDVFEVVGLTSSVESVTNNRIRFIKESGNEILDIKISSYMAGVETYHTVMIIYKPKKEGES